MWYAIGLLALALVIVSYLYLNKTKAHATVVAENKDLKANVRVVQEQLKVAAEEITPADAYAGLKEDTVKPSDNRNGLV